MDIFKHKKLALVIPLAVAYGLVHYLNQKAEVLNPTSFAQSTVSQAKASKIFAKKAAQRKLTPLQKDIAREASQLYDHFENPEQVETRIKNKALHLSANDVQELAQIALNNNGDKDERTVATYFLKLAGPKAQNSLIAIFTAPSSALARKSTSDEEDMDKQYEYGLRTMALEGVEDNIHQTHIPLPADIMKQDDPYLSGLLKIVLAGEQAQRPMLKEFINKSLEKVVSL